MGNPKLNLGLRRYSVKELLEMLLLAATFYEETQIRLALVSKGWGYK
jgi:hypothetical protein